MPETGGRKFLCARNMHQMDGGNAEMVIDHAIQQASRDVRDRPMDDAKRKVTITLELTPKMHDTRPELEYIEGTIKVQHTPPVRRNPQPYRMLPGSPGELPLFQPTSPYEPRQDAFDTGQASISYDPETGEELPAGNDQGNTTTSPQTPEDEQD